MSTRTATLIEDPITTVTAGGDRIRTVALRLHPNGFKANGRIHDPPGDHTPYRSGDRVRVQVVNGEPGSGVHVTGLFGSNPSAESESNREIHARGAADLVLKAEKGDVFLGRGSAASKVALALHPEITPDLASLQAQILTIAKFLVAVPVVGPAFGIEFLKTLPLWDGGILSGAPGQLEAPQAKPAANVFAKAEETQ